MSYDPRDYGADCEHCPLYEIRESRPIPVEWPDAPQALLVGEAPGAEEAKRGQPFIGRAGLELMEGLRAVGVPRSRVALTNVVLCRPPENKYDLVVHRVQQANKKREKEGRAPLPTPAECCFPRLRQELVALPKVVALGGTAFKTVIGPGSIMEQRGSPRERRIGEGEEAPLVRVLPTLHPSFVMRSKRWRAAFRADLARAFRWFGSGLSWREPNVLYVPRPEQLRLFIESLRAYPFSVFDVETFAGYLDHFEPMVDKLKCLGIGVGDGRAVVVPFRSVEQGGGGWYTRSEQHEIVEILKYYLTSPSFKKCGWNSRYYDRMVTQAQLGVIPTPHLDGIVVHRVAEPELPHGLAYAGSVHTDVHKWKAGHLGANAERDADLWKYNATDCVVTAMSIPPLVQVARERRQDHLIPIFHKLEDICVGLHQNGLPVDQEKRREWDRRLLFQANGHRAKIRNLADMPNLNPASFPQVADLLFEKLNIAPHHYTELGDPSTDDDALRAFLSETWGLDEKRKAVVSTLRDFRRVTKRRGVVVRLRPITEEYYEGEDLVVISDETEEEREERFRRASKGKARAPGLVLPDGRVHADWNCHGTTGWRFSSSNPNLQNLEDKLRDIFVAPPGYVFVACDEAQLELRMVVGLAGAKYYIEKFKAGADPHRELCVDVFGEAFLKASPEHQKKLRRCVKELTYSSLYGAEDKTKHEVVTSAEDEDESLLFPDFSLREVAAFSNAWFRRNPEVPDWWESLVVEERKQGYLAEPILGLRCDFLDGPGSEGFLNRLYNYKAQSGGAALVHLATFKLLEQIPFFKWGHGTGLVQQGHDSLVLLVPAEHGPWKVEEKKGKIVETYCEQDAKGNRICGCTASKIGKLMEECMTAEGRKYGMDVAFTGESKVGRTLKAV